MSVGGTAAANLPTSSNNNSIITSNVNSSLSNQSPLAHGAGSPPNGLLPESHSNQRPMLNHSPLTTAALPPTQISSLTDACNKESCSSVDNQRSPPIGSAAGNSSNSNPAGSMSSNVIPTTINSRSTSNEDFFAQNQSASDARLASNQSQNFNQWTTGSNSYLDQSEYSTNPNRFGSTNASGQTNFGNNCGSTLTSGSSSTTNGSPSIVMQISNISNSPNTTSTGSGPNSVGSTSNTSYLEYSYGNCGPLRSTLTGNVSVASPPCTVPNMFTVAAAAATQSQANQMQSSALSHSNLSRLISSESNGSTNSLNLMNRSSPNSNNNSRNNLSASQQQQQQQQQQSNIALNSNTNPLSCLSNSLSNSNGSFSQSPKSTCGSLSSETNQALFGNGIGTGSAGPNTITSSHGVSNSNPLDEASQASTPSSQLDDLRADTPKIGVAGVGGVVGLNSVVTGNTTVVGNQIVSGSTNGNNQNTNFSMQNKSSVPMYSFPPTPNTIGSPGASLMSTGFYDDYETPNNSNWPKTHQRIDGLMKLYELSGDPARREFLDKLIAFNEGRGVSVSSCPTVNKILIDLYLLYLVVKQRGGFLQVTKSKQWKECAQLCKVTISSTTAYILRKQYIKHLLPFECRFDGNGVDPQLIISQTENTNRKKRKSKNQQDSPTLNVGPIPSNAQPLGTPLIQPSMVAQLGPNAANSSSLGHLPATAVNQMHSHQLQVQHQQQQQQQHPQQQTSVSHASQLQQQQQQQQLQHQQHQQQHLQQLQHQQTQLHQQQMQMSQATHPLAAPLSSHLPAQPNLTGSTMHHLLPQDPNNNLFASNNKSQSYAIVNGQAHPLPPNQSAGYSPQQMYSMQQNLGYAQMNGYPPANSSMYSSYEYSLAANKMNSNANYYHANGQSPQSQSVYYGNASAPYSAGSMNGSSIDLYGSYNGSTTSAPPTNSTAVNVATSVNGASVQLDSSNDVGPLSASMPNLPASLGNASASSIANAPTELMYNSAFSQLEQYAGSHFGLNNSNNGTSTGPNNNNANNASNPSAVYTNASFRSQSGASNAFPCPTNSTTNSTSGFALNEYEKSANLLEYGQLKADPHSIDYDPYAYEPQEKRFHTDFK